MRESITETVLRRDRWMIGAALTAITVLAWAYIALVAAQMDMTTPAGGSEMQQMMEPVLHRWSISDFLFMFAMWAVMMAGMMTPSVSPMVLIYARVARMAIAQGTPFASATWFTSGYLLAWTGFSLAATMLQWALESSLLLTPMMAAANNLIGGAVLIGAGLYQWTPFKDTCLSYCQAPMSFIQRHGGFRRDRVGSVRLGALHGLYCIGCCWPLMLLLFVGGVMNLLWIAALILFVLLEKLVPVGRALSRIAGIGLILGGVWTLMAG